jgi:hypothetical protein
MSVSVSVVVNNMEVRKGPRITKQESPIDPVCVAPLIGCLTSFLDGRYDIEKVVAHNEETEE